jgi:acetolactate synthase-1/2/3 large subunit
MQVYEAISELIRRSDLRVVFGLFGSANVAWVGHGVQAGTVRWVRTRHEETSVAAAAAYSKATGTAGLATATMGPGFANTVNALAAAAHDHVPVILITGQSPSGKRHGDFQRLNQREIAAALGVGFHNVGLPDQLEAAYVAALQAALWNGTPQVLSIDEAILGEQVELTDGESAAAHQAPEPEASAPDPESVAAVVDLLQSAACPLVLAGRGAVLADCRADLLAVADILGARVATTLGAPRYFAGHPTDLGVCGTSSSPVVKEALHDTDVVLAVGATLNSFTTSEGGIFPAARIIQCEIDVDQQFRASSPELGLVGDAGASVRAVLAELRRRGHRARSVRSRVPGRDEAEASVLKADLGHDPRRGLDLRHVYATLNRKLPAERIVVTDGGRAGIPLPALLEARDERSWLTSRGYGSIGLGVGASIGAALAAPDRPVVLFCGDGGFMMAAQELDTIRLHDLNVTIVVMNDAQYGSEIKYLKKLGLPLDVARQSMPDLMLLARAFGGDGIVLRSEQDLTDVELPLSGLFIVDVRLDPEINPANI